MDYETEEQQVEAIKKWWKENGSMVMAGVLLGIVVIFGWRYYDNYQKNHAEYASNVYNSVMQIVATGQGADDLQIKVNELLAEYSDTPYASLSALVLAKQQIKSGDFTKAQQQLEWVINNADQEELRHIARLRLTRLLFAGKQYDAALKLLNVDYPKSFAVMYEELKGDLYVAQGELNMARVAYDKAILNSGLQAGKWLKLKRDDLGSSEKQEPSA